MGVCRRVWSVLAAASMVGLGAWGALRAATTNSAEIGPARAVERYFDAVSREDCGALAKSVAGALARNLEQEGCAATLGRMRSHRLRYLGAGAATVDGRDRNALLLEVRLELGGKPRTSLVRVVRQGTVFRLATL